MQTAIEKLMDRLSKLEGGAQAEAALITSDRNRFYFTGFPSSAGALLILRDTAYFMTDFRYGEAAAKSIHGCEVVCYSSMRETLQQLLKKHGVKKVLLENEKMYLEEIRCISEAFSAGFASLFKKKVLQNERTPPAQMCGRQIFSQSVSHNFSLNLSFGRHTECRRSGQNRLLCQRQKRRKRIAGEKLSRADIFSTLPRDRSLPRGRYFFRNVRRPPFRRKWDDAGPARG